MYDRRFRKVRQTPRGEGMKHIVFIGENIKRESTYNLKVNTFGDIKEMKFAGFTLEPNEFDTRTLGVELGKLVSKLLNENKTIKNVVLKSYIREKPTTLGKELAIELEYDEVKQ